MYLTDAWYVAAWDHEITREPLARTLLGTPVVLWRTESGDAVALEDRCCHRHAPLSAGKIIGDHLQCGYHGLKFDSSGSCIEVPSQTRVPPGAQVRCYPLVERNRWVWIWMGEAGRADPEQIPDIYWHDGPGWTGVGDRFHVNCHYQSLIDIQLDNTHSSFVHPDTLGNAGSLRHMPKVERDGEVLHNARRMRDSDPPPLLAPPFRLLKARGVHRQSPWSRLVRAPKRQRWHKATQSLLKTEQGRDSIAERFAVLCQLSCCRSGFPQQQLRAQRVSSVAVPSKRVLKTSQQRLEFLFCACGRARV